MARCHGNRAIRKRRARSNATYTERMRRKVERQVLEMPKGVTIADRSYGFATYADTPEARNVAGHDGELSVRADTRIGGYSNEDYDIAAMHAHEHLNTRVWQAYQKFNVRRDSNARVNHV